MYASVEDALVRGYGIERAFRCHVHDDKHASASINSLTYKWFCFSCGAGGTYRGEMDPVAFHLAIANVMDRMDRVERVYPEAYLSLFDSLGPGDYWLSRFGEPICHEHRLGVSMDGRYATLPVRDVTGRIMGTIRRDLTGEDQCKYRYPPGVGMSKYLYNYHRCEGDVILLTEGATDAIAAEEAGFPNAMATYRNGLSVAQVALLRRYAPSLVLICYDQDGAGDSGAATAATQLAGFTTQRVVWTDYKDLSSIPMGPRVELMTALKNCLSKPLDMVG